MAVNIANVRLARDTGSRAWISALAALSTAIALIVLCVEVDENPATRNHLWILVGMILVSFGIEFAYGSITGRRIHLSQKPAKGDADTAQH
jgi:Co/Zn/Cd efflux system component